MCHPRDLLSHRVFRYPVLPERGTSASHPPIPPSPTRPSPQTVHNPTSVRQLLRLTPKAKTAAAVDHDVQIPKSALAAPDAARPLPLRQLLTPRVIVAAGNYAFLAVVDMTLRAIQPVFYSTPIALGGLGLTPQTIGLILALYGLVNGVLQIFLFGRVHDRFGTKRVYMAGIASMLPVFALFPVINELARIEGMSRAVWALVLGQALLSIAVNFSYGQSPLSPLPFLAPA